LKPFIFSADAHVAEPPDLYLSKMPAHLQAYALNAAQEGEHLITRIGSTDVLRVRRGLTDHKINPETQRLGTRDLNFRLKDMEKDGVDAELCFPSMALIAHRIDNREAALKTAQIYNDWVWDYLDGLHHKLVPCALLPVANLDDTLDEFRRVVAKGFAAIMLPPVLPEGPPKYNQPDWDPIFAYAGEADVPIIFHTGTGAVNVHAMKGPGGALFNYTRQMNDSVDCIAALVGGGVLDRNPRTHILFVEHGAGWLMGLAERMDEVYQGHEPMIRPKLSRKPSQIVRDQVHCTFQNDVGCLQTRKEVGTQAFLFATDYPHGEGTFPYSRQIVDHMFDHVPDITEQEKLAVLGGNAARLFPRAKIPVPSEAIPA